MLQNAAENGFGRRPGSAIFVKDFALPEPLNLKMSPALRAGFVLQVAILKGQRQILDTHRYSKGTEADFGHKSPIFWPPREARRLFTKNV